VTGAYGEAGIFGQAWVALAAFAEPEFAVFRGTNQACVAARAAQPDSGEAIALRIAHVAGSARRVGWIGQRPDAAEANAHDGGVVAANDRAVATLFDQRALRNARDVLEAHAVALFQRSEHAHIVGCGAQIGGRFIHLGESVGRGAANPAGVGEDVHLITLAEEHDARRARVQEADYAPCLGIGACAPAKPRPYGFERRSMAIGGGIGHGE
jgi:hypothetical protein